VDWYPWGPEAFERAKREDRPVLLSVGYSACHWCHVMERECFEDPGIAGLMNARFVNVKVDREERPDVDQVYMTAVQALTGRGGWPMTVFLTPDGKPFYAGTYFPPADRHQMPGFPRVLQSVADAYHGRREEITKTAAALVAEIAAMTRPEPTTGVVAEAALDAALADLERRYDAEWGGFGGAPKFPPSMTLELLLRLAARGGEARDRTLGMATHTLEMMARGGMYDQLGGGFHRYSTDERWLVPHFEKMLYDNALLARAYVLAYQATRNVLFEVVATETLEYVRREMTSPEGAFYSAQDADSEGEEGKFFAWDYDEILDLLGDEDGRRFAAAFAATETGNFEGKNVLWLPRPLATVAKELGVATEQVGEAVARGRRVLFEAREKRVKPMRDEKAVTSWNGLMLRAFATAASVLGRDDYLEVARRNATFLLTELRANGRLLRTWKDGRAKGDAFLEDYANVIDGLLALHEASLEPTWLEEALKLAAVMLDEFWDKEVGAFYDAGLKHERLVARPRHVFDNATPAGSSVAADVALRLARMTGAEALRACAEMAVASTGKYLARYPSGFGRLLGVVDALLQPGREVVIVGGRDHPAVVAFREAVFHRYRPDLLVAGGPEAGLAALADKVPLFAGRTLREGQPAAYLCTGMACALPTSDPAELVRQLGEG
jgi:uncharacterized protein YyaL (SSP411 family)